MLSDDPQELRRALRHVAAISALPAAWTECDAGDIGDNLTEVLVDLLGLDCAYFSFRLAGATPVESLRLGEQNRPEATAMLRRSLAELIQAPVAAEPLLLKNPLGKGNLRALLLPVTHGGKALLIAAAAAPEFPSATQRLLLEVLVNQAALAIGRWQSEHELHRLNDTLEQRVAAEIKARLTAEEAFRQAQKMEAIGQLTGGIAHDFNNILTAIFGSLEMVLGSEEPDEMTRRMVGTALRSAGRGARLTQQLLAFSRRQVLQPKLVNLNELVGEMRVLIQRAVGEAIEVSCVLAPSLPSCLIDPAQFETAVLNLVINARDAMPGGGRLRIETSEARLAADSGELPGGDYVLLSVSDSGAGMSGEVLAHAFEPFFTTKEVGKGSGLGLSMVYGFAKQSAGTVRISSAPETGTSVQLYLPALAVAAERGEHARDSAVVLSGSGTILLVEDNAEVRSATADVLQSLGYRVVTAPDGRAALELTRRRRAIDLLVTDVVMPGGMSGIELARRVRRLNATLPVLLMSGYSPESAADAVSDLHCGFIAKPFRPAELGKAIHDLLRAARSG